MEDCERLKKIVEKVKEKRRNLYPYYKLISVFLLLSTSVLVEAGIITHESFSHLSLQFMLIVVVIMGAVKFVHAK